MMKLKDGYTKLRVFEVYKGNCKCDENSRGLKTNFP